MNYRSVFIFLSLIILENNIINAQYLKIGFRIEPTIMITEQNNSSSVAFAPYAFSLTAIIEPVDGIGFEVRPGFSLGGEYYGGFELGAFARWMILSSRFYLTGGLNNHSNSWVSSHNGGSGYRKNILYKGIGLGFQKDSKLSIDIIYYFTNDKEFAYSMVYDSYGNTKLENKLMDGLIKIGFSLAWDLL